MPLISIKFHYNIQNTSGDFLRTRHNHNLNLEAIHVLQELQPPPPCFYGLPPAPLFGYFPPHVNNDTGSGTTDHSGGSHFSEFSDGPPPLGPWELP
jgi:hypothetical protein